MNLREVLIKKDLFKYFNNIENEAIKNNLLNKSSLNTYKKGDIIYFNPEDENVLIFLEGKYHIRSFISDEADYIYPGSGEFWLGIYAVLGNESSELEISFAEDTTVLSLPLKELLYSDPSKNVELWMLISKMSTKRMMHMHRKSAERLVLPTEVYFLKSLVENNYIYEGVSVQDISYKIHVNTRTLQRVVQNLEKEGLLIRDKAKKIIKVSDRNKVDTYLESVLV